MTEQMIEENLDEAASKLIQQAEMVTDELYLAAQEMRRRRLAARRDDPLPFDDPQTATVKPVALEGLSEAEAVMDYKRALLQAAKWVLEGYPEAGEEVRMRTGMYFAEQLGEDVWNALLALWAE